MYKERVIFHVDLDCFYASVEMQEDPSLKGKCVAVCGDVEKRHGIILAKSYPAKKYGIKTGEAAWEAKQKCPNLVLVNAHFDLYEYYSSIVTRIYRRYSDLVEPFGLDENWIDVTGSLSYFGLSPFQLAKQIQDEILFESGLTASIGIGWNKIIAKFASDYKKPFGITEINRENFETIFWQAPAEDLMYVGRKTAIKFKSWGINTIGDIAADRNGIITAYGGKIGRMLICWAKGYDDTPVGCFFDPNEPCKSVGNSITAPKDIYTYKDAEIVLQVLSESVATRLKQINKIGSVISMGFRNSQLKGLQRQRKIHEPTNIAKEILNMGMILLKENWYEDIPLRSLGISVSGLKEDADVFQVDLFEDHIGRAEEKKIDETIDTIRNRYGHNKVKRCSLLLDEELTDFNPLTHTIHPVGYLK